MAPSFAELREDYGVLWRTCGNRPAWRGSIDKAAEGILKAKGRYRIVQDLAAVPWFVVGLVHQMESDRNFKSHLHNGDPLAARTCNVPFGRPNTGSPPFTWEESAADAVRYSKLDQVLEWDCERVCFELEKYNGFRSRTEHGIRTPYLWSGTSHYECGKFVRDNVWDPNAVSKQAGAIPILQRLMELDPTIAERLSAPAEKSRQGMVTDPQETFDLLELQRRLGAMPLYADTVDNIFGRQTRNAIRALLVQQQVAGWETWSGERLVVAGKQMLCHLDDIEVGEIDGIPGPQTQFALSVYAARKRGDTTVETWRDHLDDQPAISPPSPRADTWPVQRDVTRLFGEVGQNQARLAFPYPMRLAWDTSTTVKSTSCHVAVHDAAARVLERVLSHYGIERIRQLRLDLFGGCLNVRKMRGGSTWSMHSWGIAFDFDPERNQLRWGRDKASFAQSEYTKWFELWEEEGAVSLGRARDFDWMHVQFARV